MGQVVYFLDKAAVAERIGVCPRTIRRWCSAGQFPQPIRFGRRTHRWRLEDIDEFVESHRQKKEEVRDDAKLTISTP